MKARGSRPARDPERRRNLAELNLLSEPRAKAASSRRGCMLPLIGIGLTLLAAAAALGGSGL